MYFIGDTHSVRTVTRIMDNSTVRDDNLIHVGDFGLGFQDIEKDIKDLRQLDDYLGSYGNTLYVIRGNHDNPIFWDRIRLYMPKLYNIELIPDYSIREIDGKKIFFVGGAISIDRLIRKQEHPPSWWWDEKFVLNHEKLDVLPEVTNKIDIVVTHTAPHFVHPTNDYVPIVNDWCGLESRHGSDLRSELRAERKELTQLDAIIRGLGYKPQHWFYGHFHSSHETQANGTLYKALGINELFELK